MSAPSTGYLRDTQFVRCVATWTSSITVSFFSIGLAGARFCVTMLTEARPFPGKHSGNVSSSVDEIVGNVRQPARDKSRDHRVRRLNSSVAEQRTSGGDTSEF